MIIEIYGLYIKKPAISRKFFNFIEDGSSKKPASGESPGPNSSQFVFGLQ
ncbi:MAG: hypothetical protein V3T45_03895 [Nitrospinaceae bacterium]|jgi:hypothetical protein